MFGRKHKLTHKNTDWSAPGVSVSSICPAPRAVIHSTIFERKSINRKVAVISIKAYPAANTHTHTQGRRSPVQKAQGLWRSDASCQQGLGPSRVYWLLPKCEGASDGRNQNMLFMSSCPVGPRTMRPQVLTSVRQQPKGEHKSSSYRTKCQVRLRPM